MIFSSSLADGGDKSSQIGPVIPKAPVHVHMPPELLFILDVKRDVLKSMYLLPSLMYRIESLMLSSQLRAEINGHANNFKIPSSLVRPINLILWKRYTLICTFIMIILFFSSFCVLDSRSTNDFKMLRKVFYGAS